MALVLGLGIKIVAAQDRRPAAVPLPEQPSAALATTASMDTMGSLGASEVLSPAVFLPFVAKDYTATVTPSAFGLQIYSREYDLVDSIASIGASWVHIPISWSQIEPVDTTPENYHWSASFERGLAQLSARNIKIVLTLYNNPSWAATYPAGPIDKTDPGALKEFMVAAVRRYSQPPYNVKYWEIYNEPDNGDPYHASAGWGYFGNDPQAYVDVLALLYGPIKAVDPQSQVVFGGLAYDNWTETGGFFVKSFLDDVLALGGGSYFDLMNFHYYVLFHPQWDSYGIGITGKYNYIHDKMVNEYGLSKPLICTEASMWSDAAHDGSDELQARYVPQLFARTLSTDLQATVWFMFKDWDIVGAFKYGLLNPDASRKTSFYAYQTLGQQLATASYVRTLDPAEDASGQIEAYEFASKSGPMHVIVAWSNDEAAHPMSIRTDQLVVVDRLGNETVLGPGADGRVRLDIGACGDGPVQYVIGRCPVYLRFVPEE